jgi:release factor glutamine methyltransferase
METGNRLTRMGGQVYLVAMTEATKTVLHVLTSGTAFLEAHGIAQPRLACELLLSRLLRCKRLELYMKYETPLPETLLEAMRRGIKRVGTGEPVQYVLGQVGFMEHVFKVDRRALIPRPETEVLVQHVLACEPLWKVAHPAIVDVGTGSGCIVLSLAMARPNGRYIALDTSPEALDLARENAAALGIADRIGFAPGELSDIVDPESLNAVVANLPYIPTAAYERLPPSIRDFEPRAALDGGPAGLSIIETVISEAELALLPGGYLFLEIGDEQGASVLSLLKEGGFEDVRVKPDLNGRDRIALGRTPAY